MAFISGNLRKTNAIFLLAQFPIMLRLWIEAVFWRLEHGPQMLLYQALHLEEWFWPILVLSLLAAAVYEFWVFVVTLLWLIPKFRYKSSGIVPAIAGFATVWAFWQLAFAIQQYIAAPILYAGMAILTALGLAAMALVLIGFRTTHVPP